MIILRLPLTHRGGAGGGGVNILVGGLVKVKVGWFDNDVREVFSRQLRKKLNGVVRGVSGKRRFLVRF